MWSKAHTLVSINLIASPYVTARPAFVTATFLPPPRVFRKKKIPSYSYWWAFY
jgi:hypothetical protein